MELYDIRVRGVGHKRLQKKFVFPQAPREIEDCMRVFFRHARLPGVLGAVDGCLIQTPLPRYSQRCHNDGSVDQPVAFFAARNGVSRSARSVCILQKSCRIMWLVESAGLHLMQ
jgi:hypothetical protein